MGEIKSIEQVVIIIFFVVLIIATIVEKPRD